MVKYLGVKIINAEPMTKDDFYREKGQPCDGENMHGYKVKYEDDYISWSPKNVFEKAYRSIDNLTFGLAIEALKKGYKVARKGWNGKGMFIYLTENSIVPFENLTFGAHTYITAENTGRDYAYINPHIDMKAADGTVVVGWLASQTDMLAEDWMIVE